MKNKTAILTTIIAIAIIYPTIIQNNVWNDVRCLYEQPKPYLIIENCLKPLPTPFTIKVRVLGSIFSTPTIRDLIACESSGNPNAKNLKDVHYDLKGNKSIGSFGILQFSKNTFYEYAEKAKVRNPNINNPEQQIRVAEYMISIGLGNRWSCWEKVK